MKAERQSWVVRDNQDSEGSNMLIYRGTLTVWIKVVAWRDKPD